MQCRRDAFLSRYDPAALQIITVGEIPCPVCKVIHTPEGDRKINILKEEQNRGKHQ